MEILSGEDFHLCSQHFFSLLMWFCCRAEILRGECFESIAGRDLASLESPCMNFFIGPFVLGKGDVAGDPVYLQVNDAVGPTFPAASLCNHFFSLNLID